MTYKKNIFFVFVLFGLVWFGLVWFGLVWFGLVLQWYLVLTDGMSWSECRE
jgi:hypothetical protein